MIFYRRAGKEEDLKIEPFPIICFYLKKIKREGVLFFISQGA